ncbi:PREDICTED: EP300-interacting inhibitor of differentiation 3 [Chinchilla lanigera]|uniref:EP300-interacting inhibitor of differentiation 3 n=1 Tax=Chinchilla lanigera TaxID=34839 RepID=UPI000698A763|nr:PREDICTED: EP300-interacting inhibitor of differentiation 3 [Chinchilla lanigera]
MASGQASLRELEAKAEGEEGEDGGAGAPGLASAFLAPADEEQCRRIRRQYRQLMDSVQQRRDAMVSAAGDSLSEALEEADALFDGVSRPREAALDAQFLVMASDLGCEKARQLNADLSLFSAAAFCELLLAFAGLSRLELAPEHGLGAGAGFWAAVQREAAAWLARAETLHCLLGRLLPGPEPAAPPSERPRRARGADDGGPAAPTKLARLDLSVPQETTEREVERVLGLLQACFRKCPGAPVSYFEFVVDPRSFARTVENMFHVSFLIRDGFARMRLDQDELPVLEPVDASQAGNAGTYGRKQGVIALSLQDWEDIVATFEISQAMITGSS